MIDDPTTQKIVGIPLATVLIGAVVRWFLFGFRRDLKVNAVDRAEIDLIAQQRERIKELEGLTAMLSKERNEAVSRVGGLETDVKHLTSTVADLRDQVAALRNEIHMQGEGRVVRRAIDDEDDRRTREEDDRRGNR